MFQPPRFIEIALSDAARDRIAGVARDRPYPIDDQYEDYIDWARTRVLPEFPSNVQQVLRLMASHPTPPGVVVLRNVPVDPTLPPTPADGERSLSKETHVPEAILTALATGLGSGPIGFRKEKKTLINDLIPLAGAQGQLSNRGSLQELDMHVEQCVLADSARAQRLLLAGLRDDHEHLAATLWVDGRDVYETLAPRVREVLREPRFRFKAPILHGSDYVTDLSPIYSGPESCLQIRAVLYGDLTIAEGKEAGQALTELRRQVRLLTRPVRVTPGSLMIASNLLGMHGRTSFRPRFDGADRWLQRLIVASLWEHRGVVLEQGRVVDLDLAPALQRPHHKTRG